MAHTYAYCFADGVIHFGPTIPDGALPVAEGGAAATVSDVGRV